MGGKGAANMRRSVICLRKVHISQARLNARSRRLSWDSGSGLAAFHVDGRRSTRQIYRPGHKIRPHGTALLGQDPDTHLGDFEVTQSFVGEMTDVNMWDFALSRIQINALYTNLKHRAPRPNLFDWNSVEYEIHGSVLVVQDD